MAGEFALQAGKLAEAARWYLQAAQQTDGDAGLAERATRISMLANDDASAAKGLALWQQRAPSSLTLRSAAGALAMRRGDVKAARTELQALLADPDERGWKFALAALIGGGRDRRCRRRCSASWSMPMQFRRRSRPGRSLADSRCAWKSPSWRGG